MIPLYKVQNLAKWNTVQLFQNPHWDTTIKKTNKQNQGHGHARIQEGGSLQDGRRECDEGRGKQGFCDWLYL